MGYIQDPRDPFVFESDGIYKDEPKQPYDSSRNTKSALKHVVDLHKTEITELQAWFIEHIKYCPRGDFKIEQSSASGIGVLSSVTCSCGVKRDITDYSKW